MKSLTSLDIKTIRTLLDSKQISAVELTKAYLERIKKLNTDINAFVTVAESAALEQAKRADAHSDSNLLKGVPYAVKDNICTENIRTTCASEILGNFVPSYDATVVSMLNKQGSPLLGKLNMDEFGMGSTNEYSAFGVVKNPLNTEFVSGGSSGGCAAAVAAGLTPFALGSDTGGSVRLPAAFCGVVGMKPTYGTVSRFGLIAFASSFDQIGVITKSVYDNALVMSFICGYDKKDSTSICTADSISFEHIEHNVKDLRIAVLTDEIDKAKDDVKCAVWNAVEVFEKMGACIYEVKFKSLKYAVPAYYIISSAEASSNLEKYDGIRFGNTADSFNDLEDVYRNTRTNGFGDEVKRRILLGTYVLSSGYYDEYYKKAVSAKKSIIKEFEDLFSKYDIILCPTAPTTSFKHGEKQAPIENYLCDIYTVSANLAGLPAISFPCGTGTNGMPVGLQLIGKAFEESKLYRAAYAYEQFVKEA